MGSPLKEITPRTRARKRLKGEAVEDTPMKDRVPRRKRGERGIEMGKEAMLVESQDDEADDDEFGPSPMKALGGGNRTFTSLLVEAEIEATPVHGVRKGKGKERGNRGRPSEMLGLFGKVPRGREKGERAQVTKQPSTPAAPRHEEGVVSPQSASDPPENSTAPVHENPRSTDEADSSEELSTPAPDPLLEAAASQVSPSKPSVPTRTISLSDDEEDQWDPEGGRARRTVVIVPTRRAARAWSDDDLVHDDVDDDQAEDEVEAEEEEAAVPPLVEGTTATSTTHPSSPTTASLAPPLLWMLSLHSPSSSSKQSRLADLRVKAIFNPTDAAKLRAMKRGQEVYLPGEGGDEEADEKVMDAYAMGGEGQDEGGGEGVDDWESEDEGWKRASVGMDDDEGDW